MPSFEIEQKYRCRDLTALKRKLIRLKARLVKKGTEQNELWDRDGTLAKRKMILRLRRHGKSAELALKGPKLKSRYTKRVELQTQIEYKPMKAILTALGFRISKRYDKKREVYRLGRVMVTLDTLPRRGTFIELEGSVRDIASAAVRLGVSEQDREECSYLEMLFGWRN